RTTIPSTISCMNEPNCGASDSSRRWIPAIPHMEGPPKGLKFSYQIMAALGRISGSHLFGRQRFSVIQHNAWLGHDPQNQSCHSTQYQRDYQSTDHGYGLRSSGEAQNQSRQSANDSWHTVQVVHTHGVPHTCFLHQPIVEVEETECGYRATDQSDDP